MRLKYRHVSYEQPFSTVDCVEGDLGGQYRGQQWSSRYPRHIPVPQVHPTLKYRAVSYNLSDPRDHINVAIPTHSTKVQPKDPSVIPRQETPTESFNAVYKANVCRLLEHRQQQAEAQGNQQLLELLSAEAQQWAC